MRSEAYWTERNALVDAVLAIDTKGASVFTQAGWEVEGAAEVRARYHAAVDALKAFDEAHGGAPVL